MNYRKVVVLGSDDTAKKLISLLNKKRELGYIFTAFFSDKTSKDEFYKGPISDSFKYVLDNNIDEVYCSLTQFKKEEIKKPKEAKKFIDKESFLEEIKSYFNKNKIKSISIIIYIHSFILVFLFSIYSKIMLSCLSPIH